MALETDCELCIAGKVKEVENFLSLFPPIEEPFLLSRILDGDDENGHCCTRVHKIERTLSEDGRLLTAKICFSSRTFVPDQIIVEAAMLYQIPHLTLLYQPDACYGCGEIVCEAGRVTKNDWQDYSIY